MPLVVADTGPLNYLTLIGHLNVLPRLWPVLSIPGEVFRELTAPGAPPAVSRTFCSPPWLEIVSIADQSSEPTLQRLDVGERAAIRLALELEAHLVLIDDRKAALAARGLGLPVTGTLGLLDAAADLGLLDFEESLLELSRTNFRKPPAVLDELVRKHVRRRLES